MLYLTCTTITSVDLAHYGVSRAKDWVSVDCGTKAVFCKKNTTSVNIYMMNISIKSQLQRAYGV